MLNLILRRGLPSVCLALSLLTLGATWIGRSLETQELAYLSQLRSLILDEQIYLMDIRRGLTVAITDGFLDISTRPQWTADGKNLLFAANQDQNSVIYRLNLETGSLKRLTTTGDRSSGRITEVALSPDGDTIAFIRTDLAGNVSFPYLVNMDSSGEYQLKLDQVTHQDFLNWSPDGRRLIFTMFEPHHTTEPELWLLDVSNLETETPYLVLKDDQMIEFRPNWLSNEQIGVYVVAMRRGNLHPYRMINIATGESKQLMDNGSFLENAAWSQQDRETLLYYARASSTDSKPFSYILFRRNILNGDTGQIAEVAIGATIAEMRWSFDEDYVAVTTSLSDVLVIRLEDGQIIQSTKLTDHRNRNSLNPAWRP